MPKNSIKIPDEIMKDCEARRSAAISAAEARYGEVAEKCPEIRDIRRARINNAFELSLALKDAEDENARAKLKEDMLGKNAELIEREKLLLRDMGLSGDYLEPRFSCTQCNDTGLIGEGVKRPCSCVMQRALRYSYASSNLENGEYFESHNPNIFRDNDQRERHELIMRYAEKYADNIPYFEVSNLLLMGDSGLGKSFVLNCIGHRAIERGLTVVKLTAYNLIKQALEAMRNNQTPPDYSDVDLLLLDDLGTEPDIRNVTNEQLFAIINERYVQSKNTVISTNLDIDSLQDAYGERLFSRMISQRNTKVIGFAGEDLRIVGK